MYHKYEYIIYMIKRGYVHMENIVKCAFVIVGLFHIYNFISNITVFHIHIRHDFLINTLRCTDLTKGNSFIKARTVQQ